jgi:hypothetical protein
VHVADRVRQPGEGQTHLRVRQSDAAGNASEPLAYEWEVAAKAPDAAPASKVTARISTVAAVTGNRTVGVGCKLDQAGLETCTVKADVTVDGPTSSSVPARCARMSVTAPGWSR